ncbi:hypothetical protein GCM10009762_28160 [Dermacoccus barathri]|uniref:Uncharacterized protein n=1 Tax=Dermacoccus barathri TaxID=322601 RepID=A0ABN2CAP1_9MICO
MRDDDLLGVAATAQLDDGVHALLEGQEDVDAEAVHAEQAAGVGELAQVVEVGRVAAVTDDDLAQIDAFFAEDALGDETGFAARVGVHGDRSLRLSARGAHSAHDSLDTGGQPLLLDGALEERCTHTRVTDALAQILEEELGHRLRAAEQSVGSGVVELEGDVVVRVDARGHDDVEVGAFGHLLDARDVSTQPQYGGVHDGVDAESLEFLELADGLGNLGLFVPFAVIDAVLLAEHEDVLVDERGAEVTRIHDPLDGLDISHRSSPPRWSIQSRA